MAFALVSGSVSGVLCTGTARIRNLLSEGALQCPVTGHRVAEALRPAAKLLGLWREASPSAVADSMELFIYIY